MSHDDHEYYGGSSVEDDPHVYDNGVLVNNFDIKTTAELSKFEAEVSGLRGIELHDNPIFGCFDLDHAKRIHHHLFKDVYPWAGSTRAVDISKGDTFFLSVSKIESEFDKVTQYLNESGLTVKKIEGAKEFSSAAGVFLGMVNHIHPFREGNGRTQRQLLRMLALEHGFEIDWSGTSPESMKKACIESREDNSCKALGRLIFLAQKRIPENPVLNSENNRNLLDKLNSENISTSTDEIDDILNGNDQKINSDIEPGIS